MIDGTKRIAKTRAQLDLAKALRNFIKSPLTGMTLEHLCSLIARYELDARFGAAVEETKTAETARAEVKAEKLCRDCRVRLDGSNRANVAGYQCVDCKRKYTREHAARRRALQKETTPAVVKEPRL